MDLRLGFLALLILFATACSADKISVAPLDDSTDSSPINERVIEEPVPSQTEPRPTYLYRDTVGCLGDPQLWSFDSDVAAEIGTQPESLEEHIARSPLMVTGQLGLRTDFTSKGTGFVLKVFAAVGLQEYDRAKLDPIWVPGTFSVRGSLGDRFVAFLTGDEIQYSNRQYSTRLSAWEVHPEGLWIECNGTVSSIGVASDGSARAVEFDDPMTADELWNVVSTSGLPELDLWYWE